MDTNFNTPSEQAKQEKESIIFIIADYFIKLLKMLFFAILFFALCFHWMPDHGHIFPKESLSFANTIISHEDVDQLIARHNQASGFERALISKEYIHIKLQELGIIISSMDSE